MSIDPRFSKTQQPKGFVKNPVNYPCLPAAVTSETPHCTLSSESASCLANSPSQPASAIQTPLVNIDSTHHPVSGAPDSLLISDISDRPVRQLFASNTPHSGNLHRPCGKHRDEKVNPTSFPAVTRQKSKLLGAPSSHTRAKSKLLAAEFQPPNLFPTTTSVKRRKETPQRHKTYQNLSDLSQVDKLSTSKPQRGVKDTHSRQQQVPRLVPAIGWSFKTASPVKLDKPSLLPKPKVKKVKPPKPTTPDQLDPNPIMAATADEVRLIINQTLGTLGPLINPQGGIVQGAQGGNAGTLLQRLRRRQGVSKPPGPPMFCGASDDDPVLFKEKLSDYIAQIGYDNEEDKVRAAKMFLTGTAHTWFKTLNPAPANLQALWDAFDTEFIKGEAARTLLDKLLTRKQMEHEDVMTYAEDIIAMATQLDWKQPLVANNAGVLPAEDPGSTRIKEQIIAGLTPSIKSHVVIQNPETLASLLSLLKRLRNVGTTAPSQDLSAVQQSLAQILSQMKSDKKEKQLAAVQQEATPQPTVQAMTHTISPPQYVQNSAPPGGYQQQYVMQPYNEGNQPQYVQNNLAGQFGRAPRNRFRGNQTPASNFSPPKIIINTVQQEPTNRRFRPQNTRFPRGRYFGSANTRQAGCYSCGSPEHWFLECPSRNVYNYPPASRPPVMYQQPQGPQAPPQSWPPARRGNFQRRKPNPRYSNQPGPRQNFTGNNFPDQLN